MTIGLLAACAGEPAELAGDRAGGPDLGTSSRASLVDADLVVRSVRGPHSAMPQAWLEVTAEVCNQGGAEVPYSDVRVVLSEDDTIDELDVELFTAPVFYLAPGGCMLVSASGSVPDQTGGYRLGAIADVFGMVVEADETNNAGAGSALGVGYEPDLVVDRVRAPATSPSHDRVDIEVRVCNQGPWLDSSYTSVMVEITQDGNPVLLPAGSASVPSLRPGDCFNAIIPLAGLPASVYELSATVDPSDEVPEIVEDNNTHAGGRVGVGDTADLIVTGIGAPLGALPGEIPGVTVTACNQGQGPVYASVIEMFLSEDDVFDPMADMPIGLAQVPRLEPAQCAPLQAMVGFWPTGTFRLVAVIDAFQGEPEIFEDNNVLIGEPFGIGVQPDLVVTEVARVPGSPSYTDFLVDVQVCNLGQQFSDSADLELRLSTDDEITAGDVPAGFGWVPGLAPGVCTRAQVWTSLSPIGGPYVLGALVDPDDDVDELIETNNGGAGPRVNTGSEPDLVITAVSAPTRARLSGYGTTVFVQVCNHGGSHSQGAEVTLHASRNDDVSVDDVPVGDQSVSGLAPSACASVAVPSMLDVPPGAYLLGAVVDEGESIDEGIEDNNVGFSAPIAVGDGPDLVVTNMTAPPSALPGVEFEIAATVCNEGFEPSPGAPLAVLVSDDRHIGWPGDFPVAYTFTGPLQPGQCYTTSMPAVLSGFGVAQWLAAVVDPDQQLNELLEDNNSQPARVIGVGSDPDLVVTALGAPVTVQPYETMAVTARVCNQGQGPSPGTDVAVQLGATTFSPGGPTVGMSPVPPLAAGGCTDVAVDAHTAGLFGDQALIATVDPTRWGVPELVEDNNTSPVVRIGIGYEADLIVSRVRGPASAQPWTTVDVTARVCNQGEAASSGARLDVVISPDARIDAIDHVLATIPVPFLAQGACELITAPVMMSVFYGVYTLGAVVHLDAGPPELVTSNNAAAGGPLALGWEADLVVSTVKGPATAAMGSQFAVQVKVCNRGQSPSQPADVWAVLSRDSIVDMGDAEGAPVTTAPVGSVAPGACELVSVPALAYPMEGTYVLGALVDPWGSVYELIESNNTGAGAAIEIVAPL